MLERGVRQMSKMVFSLRAECGVLPQKRACMAYTQFLRKHILFCLVVCLVVVGGYGQQLPSQFGGPVASGTDSLGGVVIDTARIEWFLPERAWEVHPFADSTLVQFHQYDPVRRQRLPWASLGNLGSAAYPLFFDVAKRQGFDVGIHAWDLYLRAVEQIPYYRVSIPFSNLYYSQGQAQDDARFKGQFSRNFAHQLNFSLDHQAINNLGAFNNQRTRVISLGMGLWWQRLGGRYQAFLTFAENNMQAQEPGAIGPPPADTLVAAFTLATTLDEAYVRFANRDWSWFHLLRLKADSSSQHRFDWRIGHRMTVQQHTYKYFDSNPPADTSFYRLLQTDDRGLRQFVRWQTLANRFFLRLHRPQQAPPAFELGIVHRYHQLYQEPRDSNLHDLFVQGDLQWQWRQQLYLSANAHMGLWQNLGEYKIAASLSMALGQAGRLSGGMLAQRYRPPLLAQQAWISHQRVWQNALQPIGERALWGHYQLAAQAMELEVRYVQVHNYLWWDSLATPQQATTPVHYWRVWLSKDFAFGPLHLDNRLLWQRASSTVLRLPTWYAAHSLYLQGSIFRKAMEARIGIDARFITRWQPVAWMPLLGQFYLQEAISYSITPLIDLHVAFRVKTFRFFFKVENLVPYIDKQYYALIAHHYLPYGLQGGGMRFGLSWRLMN